MNYSFYTVIEVDRHRFCLSTFLLKIEVNVCSNWWKGRGGEAHGEEWVASLPPIESKTWLY